MVLHSQMQSFDPTYKGWKRMAELQELIKGASFDPTYKGWKQSRPVSWSGLLDPLWSYLQGMETGNGSYRSYWLWWALILPTRDGNSFFLSNAFNGHLALWSYLQGMETKLEAQLKSFKVHRFDPTYKGWKRAFSEGV